MLRLARAREVRRLGREGGHSLERGALRLPVAIVSGRELGPRVLRLLLPDLHQAVGIGEPHRADEDVVGNREGGGGGTDAESGDEDGRGGVALGAHQRSEGIAQVLPQEVGVHAPGSLHDVPEGGGVEGDDRRDAARALAARGEDPGHVRRVLGAEARGVEVEERAIEPHQSLSGARPLWRASLSICVSRRASARATAVPKGVKR